MSQPDPEFTDFPSGEEVKKMFTVHEDDISNAVLQSSAKNMQEHASRNLDGLRQLPR
jgi:hypothetical protein